MAISRIKKKLRYWRRRLKRSDAKVYVSVGVLLIGLVSYLGFISMNTSINPTVYKPLLHMIAEVESNGNYNAYFGDANNQSVDLTSMTVQEVMNWQAEFIAQGNASSAVGRYQIIDTTLASLVRELSLDVNQKFDEKMQDHLAVTLLERRGASEYINGSLSAEQFAANLAMEWAALPRVLGGDPDQSYYANDGLNQSRITRDQVLAVIETIAA